MAAADASRTVVAGATRTNTTFSAPSGIADGDVLLCLIQTGSNPVRTVTAPAGWSAVTTFPITMTSFGGDPYVVRQHAFIKVASGESGSYTFSHSSAWTEGVLTRCTGVDNTTPIDATPTTDNHASSTGGNSVTAPTITTTVNDALIFYWGGVWDGFGNASPPSGTTPTFTERANDTAGVFYAASGVLATAGATGAKTVTVSQGDNRPWMAGLIALRASSGGSTQNLAGTADGTSTTTALLSTTKVFAGTATGLSTTAGALGVTYVFAGSATGLSTTTGLLGLSLPFAGSAAGQATADANLSRQITFAGSAIGQATADGAVSVSLVFAASSTGLSSALGAFNINTVFAGSAAGLSTTTSVLSLARNFAGSATGVATADAAVSVALVFAGSAAGTSTTIAAFAGDSRLIGTSDGIATAQAALSVNIALAGAASGLSTAEADLRPERNFAGAATGSSTTTASLALGVAFAASATGQSTAVASLGVAVAFAASAVGSSSAIGDLRLVGEFETTPGPYEVTAIDVFSPGLRRWAIFIQSEQTVFLGGQE